MADIILATEAAPATPPSGSGTVYVDSTTKRLATKDDAGVVVSYNPTSPSVGIGYQTGAGAAVTQITSRSTGVTINAISGQITGTNTSLAAGADAVFVVTNSACTIQDVPMIAVQSGPTANTSIFTVSAVANGSFSIRIKNVSAATADTGAPILNFVILRGVKA